MMPVRAAFVMEQTLGHATHFQNLRAAAADQVEVQPTWLPIPFDTSGPARFVPLLRSNWSLRASWLARRALDAAHSAQSHDAVVFHTQVTALFSHAIMRRVPSIISLDATPINFDQVGQHYGHVPAGNSPVDRQKYRMNRRTLHAAARLVTWSEWARQSLVEDYGVDAARVEVIPPGAGAAFVALGARRAVAPPKPADGRPMRVLFVGGDFARKGGAVLLEALRGPLAACCQVDIVTRDDVAPQPGVTIHHGLEPNSPTLLRLFEEADLFVLPSLADCLAVVLMEAAAAGLPIITTDVGALREAVRDGLTGLVVRPGQADDLRSALELLVTNHDRRVAMGRAAHAFAQERFDARRNGRTLLNLVADVALTQRQSRRGA
jgi:glycosyltransferase involved in cell wall biosynthesis